jgi:hypothetical protein
MATYLSTGGEYKWYKLEGEEADDAEVELAFDISASTAVPEAEDDAEGKDAVPNPSFHELITHPNK